ncbi:16S rRNA (adenine(1518)-N(6)/adenine(1519)-N(6))-dimethyltransferase RsmA [Mesomycoplasma conjunctivae]|uniref:16S rRNA (adenine(1518)-N(6)/adenine(1519)-N(6))- dimethyltransferase RsmA n=1 Tax=Mesomycoplasma conjunctivae TaxID=45361 RepID=UPI003DA50820
MSKFVFKKKYGQNFLKDENIVKKIVNSVDITNKEVIEIGPGGGALTQEIVKKCSFLRAYEIDTDLIENLKKKFSSSPVEIINEDFLETNLDFFSTKQIVLANLPYYITSNIIFKILSHINKFSEIVIMVQDEVADRIVAKVNTKDYSKLSLSCQYIANVEKILKIPPSAFIPQPSVNSAVVVFRVKENIDQEKFNNFLNFVKKSFAMKRKTLFNNFLTFIEKDKIKQIYSLFKLDFNVRPQQISLDLYNEIFEFLYQKSF